LIKTEDEIREHLIAWLKKQGFLCEKGIKIKTFEIDVAALGKIRITKEKIHRSEKEHVYAFECKVASTSKLVKDVIEQAITRLLVADYVYIVVPNRVEIWINGKNRTRIKPYQLIERYASGVYSKKIGIISIDTFGRINVYRNARKSGLKINELSDETVKILRRKRSILKKWL